MHVFGENAVTICWKIPKLQWFGWFVGWLILSVSWLVDRLVGWFVGWLIWSKSLAVAFVEVGESPLESLPALVSLFWDIFAECSHHAAESFANIRLSGFLDELSHHIKHKTCLVRLVFWLLETSDHSVVAKTVLVNCVAEQWGEKEKANFHISL